MKDEPVNDGRKYQVGEEVDFTDDNGKIVPGVVHGVRYQAGRYELVGEQHQVPNDPSSPVVPGTGEQRLIPGTENQHHSFEYIMVHKHQHEAWHKIEKANQVKIKRYHENIKKFRGSVDKNDPDHLKNFEKMPGHEPVEPHPELKQHIRVFEED